MYKRILCTLDGSPLAEQALPHALTMVKAFDAKLVLLRVVEIPSLPVLPELAPVEIELLPQLEDEAKAYIQSKVDELRAQGFDVEGDVVEGRAAEAIADYAGDHDIDLIVMATHGRSGLSRWAFGSVAERVLRMATCPVLLIRARNE